MANKNYNGVKYFKATKQIINKNLKFWGFDIETYGNFNKFFCCSLYSNDLKYGEETYFFTSIDEYLDFIKNHADKFRNSYIVASNLGFDFYGTLFERPELQCFKPMFRGSGLLGAEAYINNKEFTGKPNNHGKIRFIDTMNFASMSVESLGELIKEPKMKQPDFLGKIPKGRIQWQEMRKYNIQDSKVSYKGMRFLYNGFIGQGATFRNTISGVAMSLFRNKYFKQPPIIQYSTREIESYFKCYYGGRTESFKRGTFKDYNYYDINSLYPYCMDTFYYPDLSYRKIITNGDISNIKEFEGMSHVRIRSPKYMRFPLLPKKEADTGKLIFPLGSWSGYYTHVELRKALELGYKIEKIFVSYVFPNKIKFFGDYIKDLYKLRLEAKKKGDSIEYVYKILMNSLYGKFAQKFKDRESLTPVSLFDYHKNQNENFEELPFENPIYVRMKKDSEPSLFCLPLISAYVTSYARIELWELLNKHNPIYCDTDSIITKDIIKESKELGKLKKEFTIKEVIIVKPKFYFMKYIDNENNVFTKGKIKGIRLNKYKLNENDKEYKTKVSMNDFYSIIENKKVYYEHFTKLKESLRQIGLKPNQIRMVSKNLDTEDSKRKWNKRFNHSEIQDSEPHYIEE